MAYEVEIIRSAVGRFHPVIVHLPIGGLILLVIVEALAKFSRFKDAAQNRALLLGISGAAALMAAFSGWTLAGSGHYDAELLRWHKWTASGVGLGCVLAFLLSQLKRTRLYQVSLSMTFILLLAAGHLGGSITHGRGFLTGRGPALSNTLAAQDSGEKEMTGRSAEDTFFAAVVRPILRDHCAGCHGLERQEADLRLDTIDGIRKGGWSGPAIVPGKPGESLLIERVLLPKNDADRMPPESKTALTATETTLLEWWVRNCSPSVGLPPVTANR